MNQNNLHPSGVRVGIKSEHRKRVEVLEREYRVVFVTEDGGRALVSRHDSFAAAERLRAALPSVDACEIRIESNPFTH
jgi:hypothetical protein